MRDSMTTAEVQVEPFHPKPGNGGHPYPLTTMLRIYFMQNWYNISDQAMKEVKAE